MAPISILLAIALLVAVVLAILASLRIIKEHETLWRSLGQLAFVWLVPFIGPLVTINLLRKEAERATPYPSDSLDEGAIFNQRNATLGEYE